MIRASTDALPIDKLKVIPGRAVDEATVEALVKSIQEVGLLHPISVGVDAQVLAGVHRVEAFRRLGRKTIPAIVHHLDSLRSRLARIDENLIRNEGTALERAEALKERKEIYETLHPATKHGGDRSSRHGGDLPPQPAEVVRFTKDTAEKAGMSERTVQRHVAVAEDLDDEAKAEIAATPVADSITELEELARHPPEEQRELAKQAKAGKPIRNPRKAMNVPAAEGEDKNERFTPRGLIEDLHAAYDFTVDASSDPRSPAAQVIGRFWTKKQDGLKQRWGGERIFINPDFDNIDPWVARVHTEMDGRKPPELVVMLLPAVRTEQRWWQDHVEPYRDGRGAYGRAWELETRFLDGRTRFGSPADPEGENAGSPVFGCVLLVWQRAAVAPAGPTPGKFGFDRPGNWKLSSARKPKGHAFTEANSNVGLCGAVLGKNGDMPGSEDPICDRCAELVAQSSSTSAGSITWKPTNRRGGSIGRIAGRTYYVKRSKSSKVWRAKGFGPWCWDWERPSSGVGGGGAGPFKTPEEAQADAQKREDDHFGRRPSTTDKPRRRSSSDSLVKGQWRRGKGTAHFYEDGHPDWGSVCGRPFEGTVAIEKPKAHEQCMTCKAYVERQEAFRAKSPPADDDGSRCGIRERGRGDPCILDQGHDAGDERPLHSTGTRTWRERKPKAKKGKKRR